MTKLKYIIWNPWPITYPTIFECGGCVNLCVLFENFKNLNEEVYLAHKTEQFIPGLQHYEEEDFFSLAEFPNLENSYQLNLNECVTIYPEVTSGNPMGSKHVVRWLLHYPDYHLGHGSETWQKEDLLFAYGDWQRKKSEEMGYKVNGNLTPPLHISYDIFKDRSEPRKGTCYTIRKTTSHSYYFNI